MAEVGQWNILLTHLLTGSSDYDMLFLHVRLYLEEHGVHC